MPTDGQLVDGHVYVRIVPQRYRDVELSTCWVIVLCTSYGVFECPFGPFLRRSLGPACRDVYQQTGLQHDTTRAQLSRCGAQGTT